MLLSVAFARALLQLLLLAPTAPQDPQAVAPRAYKREFENERVRVTRVHYEPREKIPEHDHPDNATVYVYLRDGGPVRFVHTGHDAFTLVRPPVRAGGFRLSRGRQETHSVESLSDLPSDFLRIELKGFTAAERHSFLGRFPPEPRRAARAGQRVRFENARVRVARVTCAARARCAGLAGGAGAASLLVALAPSSLRSADGGTEVTLALGETMWAEPGGAPPFVNAAPAPAEFLRIDLKNAPGR
ncbi:MAG TPA: hypothetical protein VF659_04915 [Pyrinomonadaceae bacterium]|jgi:hypothetical protein